MSVRGAMFALLIALGCAWTMPALAARVAIVSSTEADCASATGERKRECAQDLEETVTRLSAELEAAGFEVLSLPRGSEAEAPLPSELALDPAPVGVFAVTELRGAPAIQVVLTDRSSAELLRFTLRAPRTERARAPAQLAVRALELLRANALVLELEPLPTPAPAPVPPPLEAPAAPPATRPEPALAPLKVQPARAVWLLKLGAGMFASFEKLGVALSPTLSLGVRGERGFGAHLLAAGPSAGAPLRARQGSADVSEALVALALDYRLRVGERTALLFSLGAGGHHIAVRGHAEAPFVAARTEAWSALASLGLGARVRLVSWLWLALDVLAFSTLPRAVVRVAEQTVGAVGRPSTLTSLGPCAEW